MQTPSDIQNQVLKLNRSERLELLLKLLESIEPNAPMGRGDVMNDWINEAESRYQSWKKGDMKTISEDEVFKRLNKGS